jgi:hypothetical protein
MAVWSFAVFDVARDGHGEKGVSRENVTALICISEYVGIRLRVYMQGA